MQKKSIHSFQMDLDVFIWQACRSFGKCGWFILFSLLCLTCAQDIAENKKASEQGITKTYVNAGDDARIVFPGYIRKIKLQKCDPKQYQIWENATNQSKKIFVSQFGNGTSAICFGDCNGNRSRGTIWNDLKNVVLSLANTTKADQKVYCLKIKCSGKDDINEYCESDKIALVIVEPVTQLTHTLTGSSRVIKLGDTMQGICTADGDPAPDMKIVNNNTGEVVKEGCTNSLSYSFQIKQRQRQVTLSCVAKNNPENMPLSQVLRVDVNYNPAFTNTSASRLVVAHNRVAKLWAEADGSPTPVINITTSGGQLLRRNRGKVVLNVSQPGVLLITAYNGIPPAAAFLIEVISEHGKSDTTSQEDNRLKNSKKEDISFIFSTISMIMSVIIALMVLIILIVVYQIKAKIYKNRTSEVKEMTLNNL